MVTRKKERKENAKKFYDSLMNGPCLQAAIVVERLKSQNPHVSRCRFLAVTSQLAFMSKPEVIAESVLGIEGCFVELLDSIKSLPQVTYHESGFNDWMLNNYGMYISYKDGLVFMLHKSEEEENE